MSTEKLRPSFTFTEERLAELRAVVPEAFPDGKLDWDTLREALGEHLDDGDAPAEHFGLNWPGKREARRLAARPSKGTLRPAPGEGVSEDTTGNLFIEGDNLEVLKLLQKSYAGRVKMIYIDPPYNTGNDFVYTDDFTEPLESYLRRSGQAGEGGELLTSNPKSSGRFHTNWLNMIYPRLRLARTLLREDGIFVASISDDEIQTLRLIADEIFGEENFIGDVVWNSTKSVTNTALISVSHTHNVIYARNKDYFVKNRHHFRLPEQGEGFSNPDNDPRGPWKADPFQVGGERPNQLYTVVNPKTGQEYRPNKGCSWKNEHSVFLKLMADNRIVFGVTGEAGPQRKRFQSEAEERGKVAKTLWNEIATTSDGTREVDTLFQAHVFSNPKPTELVKRFVQLGVHNPNDAIILDFFSGSASTANAVIKLNREDGGGRKFILVQLPEPVNTDTSEGKTALEMGMATVAEIGKERIRRVIKQLQAAQTSLESRDAPEDLGFKVLKLAPSHFRAWSDYEGTDLQALQSLFDEQETPLEPGWTPDGLLTEVLLTEGFPLDSTADTRTEFTQNTIRCVASPACAHRLWVCFDNTVDPATLEALDLPPGDIFVCLDAALDDNAKLRLTQAGSLKTI